MIDVIFELVQPAHPVVVEPSAFFLSRLPPLVQPTLKYATVESVRQSSVVDLSESSQYGRKPKTSRRRPLEPIGAAVLSASAAAEASDTDAGSANAERGVMGWSTVASSPTAPESPATPSSSWPLASSSRPGAPAAQMEPWAASRI